MIADLLVLVFVIVVIIAVETNLLETVTNGGRTPKRRTKMPVYRNETHAIQMMKQLNKSFFIRNKFYTCISEVGNG